ncbi:tetratricopeptide repeat protein [Parapedobacter deserti]|uniref:Tetratricopeptide repeat protein n=1 Tax=Parapedobacter deserti TaxID=1912957 RepID=A0ABV7JMU6_9SPHI
MNDRLSQLQRFLLETPNDPFLKYALATEYLKSGATDEALQYFEDLLTNHPSYVGTYYHLGKLYEALSRKQDAISTYERGMHAARNRHNMHALSELQAAYRLVMGIDDDDE